MRDSLSKESYSLSKESYILSKEPFFQCLDIKGPYDRFH